uniref:hypothetical protein n=1 Tax=Pseudomonas syringae TaxID=317 RepID=UPI001E6422F0|nr:hypothetical protein [Pseudomonas syringae]QOQ33453.1 hypothetical protein [Pseudomonas syringae pv. actinidiae]
MSQVQLEEQLRRLVLGLTDQAIVRGDEFRYDGGVLHADDVADIALPSILCLAQDLSVRSGVGSFGYQFRMDEPNPVFPLHAVFVEGQVNFSTMAPFVSEIFHGEVMDCRQDLAVLFETAAQLVRPGFDLAANTNYSVPAGGDHAIESEMSSLPERGLE